MNGTKEPSLEFVDKILSTYIDVSADWLLRGKGTMFYEEDKPTDEALLKELAEAKVKLLVQEGITKELRDMLLEKTLKRQGNPSIPPDRNGKMQGWEFLSWRHLRMQPELDPGFFHRELRF